MLAPNFMRVMRMLIAVFATLLACSTAAMDQSAVEKLAFGEGEEKIEAIATLVREGDPRAALVLGALLGGELMVSGKRVLIMKGASEAIDAISGEAVNPVPSERDEIIVNNRLRGTLQRAVATLKLVSPDSAVRLEAAKELSQTDDSEIIPLVKTALVKESDGAIKLLLEQIVAGLELKTGNRDARLAAIRMLGRSGSPSAKNLLLSVIETEKEMDLKKEAQKSLRAIEWRLGTGERVGLLFTGISLGSILLLAALGLAITYGLMGVINMAHGEMIMIGAYTTYVVQNLFRTHFPAAFDWYPLLAVPAAFAAAATVGVIVERLVIRWLYGRPLETLLATWGVSLVLIQGIRTIFGAQNVQVENPAFMSGGVQLLANVVLPWNRIVIIGFAAAVLIGMWLLLTRTRLGLFIRGVTQNRAMASCVGVPTARVDSWAFGLGCGIAGLAGCALSQIGNVGPDLGQSYIVDSFMVVVLGGVGQLAGTVYAALGLGFANKLLESWSGAVLAKIAVLVFIIVFIQKRPQGLFALKGRSMEA
jgi:urea transport system permease protein